MWEEKRIGDFADLITKGTTPTSIGCKFEQAGINYIKSESIGVGRKLDKSKYAFISAETHEKLKRSQIRKGDILFSMAGAYLGKTGIVDAEDVPANTNQAVAIIRLNNEKINPVFVYYVLNQSSMVDFVNSTSSQSAQPNINLKDIGNLSFKCPDRSTQDKIVFLLSKLDDKIENNTQINDNLSQQIQLIYDNLADGLTGDPINLSSIIDVRDGTHDSPKTVDDGFPLVTSKHLLPYGVDLSTANLISKEDFDKTNERSIVETHDILISMIGTVGLISLVIDDPVPFAIKNIGLFKTSKCPDLYAYILTYLRSTKTTQHIEKTLAGSTQKYISLGELRKMPIILPDENQLNDFNSIVVPLIMQITNLTEENKRLAELRDTLLPKLMSGELDISNIDL